MVLKSLLVQIIKFSLVGFFVFFIDLGVFNLLILFSGINSGLGFLFFKTISFLVALVSKFSASKIWVFKSSNNKKIGSFSKFFLITLIGFSIHLIIGYLVFAIGLKFNLPLSIWANVSALAAIIATAVWNFPTYKFIVFKNYE